MQLLMIDNYDSFTYNLVQYLGELGAETEVLRNDAASVEAMLERGAAGLVISPGPGRPDAAGVSITAVRAFARRETPVLGVCLGHQAIGEALGAHIAPARRIRIGAGDAHVVVGLSLFCVAGAGLVAVRGARTRRTVPSRHHQSL